MIFDCSQDQYLISTGKLSSLAVYVFRGTKPSAPSVVFGVLLVAQGLDGVEVGGADGGNHAADEADDGQNHGGDDHRSGRDDEANVGSFCVLGYGAVKRDAANQHGDQVGQSDAGHSADGGDGEGLGQKLREDVTLARAERLFDADFAGALLHGHQHDVHQPDAGDAQGERADQGEQHLQGDGQHLELLELGEQVGDEDGAFIGGAKVVGGGQGLAQALFGQLVVAVIAEPNAVQIGYILQVAHGIERNVN